MRGQSQQETLLEGSLLQLQQGTPFLWRTICEDIMCPQHTPDVVILARSFPG